MMTTKKTKAILLAATGIVAAMMCAPALAQDKPATDTTKTDEAKSNDDLIIVKGLRKSLKSAVDKKRKAKQIVDAIDAEDVGKLPDNNVPEALAHVTGVQIDRARGEGSGVSIRGMTDIQTTINGNNNSVGDSRTTNLSDIPAELLKSVQVYKTRSADQVEGGIAGTVNVDLRRPLDLKKGLTVAGSVRQVFSNIGDTVSPYASLLLANRFDTQYGEMGVLANIAFTKNRYEENFVESESPMNNWWDNNLSSLPTGQKDVVAPYAVNYGVEKGAVARKSANLAWQWRVSDQLDFVAEASYFGSKEKRGRDRLHLVVHDGGSTISNLVLQPDGKTVKSLTLTAAGAFIGSGPESYYEDYNSDNYTTNFEAHWHNERLNINASAQYNWSDTLWYSTLTLYRFAGQKTATIDFDSANIPGGGPYIDFPGLSMSDPSKYLLFNYHDEIGTSSNKNLSGQVDLTYRLSDDKFLRSFQAGVRYSSQRLDHDYGYRDAFPNNYAGVAITSFPTGNALVSTTPDVAGFASPTWYHLSGATLASNYTAIRAWINDPANHVSYEGHDPVPSTPSNQPGQVYKSDEYTTAIYGQFNYAFNAYFPVDGLIGVRATNTWGKSDSQQISWDTNWLPHYSESEGKGNYTDVLPNVSAIVHFTPKLQWRLAYTENVQRPGFYDLRPFVEVHANDLNVYAGNPDLQANHETSYDASLEYYFGKGGIVSAAAYLKKPDGFLYYNCKTEFVAQTNDERNVCKVRNAGPGTFQGYELAAQGFFEFLPGKWSNFGGSANFTYLQVGKILYPFEDPAYAAIPGVYDAVGMSKYTYNVALYYDTPVLSARVSYNYRDKYKVSVWDQNPAYSPYVQPTSRLDAAINWTPLKYLTLSLEGTNLGKDNMRTTWGDPALLTQGIRMQARTIQLSARFRY
jgi:iron complex outermembrane recepter protein